MITLTAISPRSWEHPADRAALNTLRALPGFDEVVRKVASYFGERGVRQLFLGDAVRVGPNQRPALDALWTEVLQTMDWSDRPELYVTQTPIANAMAVGFEKPFVIVHSGLLEILDQREQRVVLGHELGHIMSGHMTYRTIALILLFFGFGNLPFLAATALLPFQLALLEWYRKSEFSSDRAGLLAVQDFGTVMSSEMKLAGGPALGDTLNVEEFVRQAESYETGGDAWDTVMKIMNTVLRTHPMHTVRAAELLRWQRSGEYDAIIAGQYARRGTPADRPLTDDIADAAGYYRREVRDTFSKFSDAFNQAREAFTSTWKSSGGGGGAGTR